MPGEASPISLGGGGDSSEVSKTEVGSFLLAGDVFLSCRADRENETDNAIAQEASEASGFLDEVFLVIHFACFAIGGFDALLGRVFESHGAEEPVAIEPGGGVKGGNE